METVYVSFHGGLIGGLGSLCFEVSVFGSECLNKMNDNSDDISSFQFNTYINWYGIQCILVCLVSKGIYNNII